MANYLCYVCYFENHGNVEECVRKLRTDFGRKEAPSTPDVRFLVKKVKETGIVFDKPKTVHTSENIAAQHQFTVVLNNMNTSETSLCRILHKDHGIMPYKVQFAQELKTFDHPMRFRLAK